jgi:hypothetical protein
MASPEVVTRPGEPLEAGRRYKAYRYAGRRLEPPTEAAKRGNCGLFAL